MQKLTIYNTLTGKKDLFKPMKGKKINLFVCGMTVYDYPHLGHARNYIVFDSFAKYLKKIGYNVFYLQNITDLDDKIIMRAKEKEVSPKDLAIAFEKEYFKSMKMLDINNVSKYARATSHIKEIISQARRLEEKGFAYEIKGDGIYYDISKFKNYGKLSGRTALQAEDSISRIDYSKDKRNRGDFCIWKFSEENEPSWPSPFGRGRPGWHIEDTAITEKFLGAQYDIHGGARDLIFPHHEAEVSLMETLSGKVPLARYWMHVGFLTIEGQKMSKSLGNFITINDFLRRHPANHLRFFVLKNLWRSPVDYLESSMIEVKSALEKVEEFLRKIQDIKNKKQKKSNVGENLIKKVKSDFYNQLSNDFNTAKALAVLFDFIKKENQNLEKNTVSQKKATEIYKFFEEVNDIFGILDFKKINRAIPAKIKKLAHAREKFRQNQEWQKADHARQEIEKQGFLVEDTKNGPSIKPAT
ncbi:MAG: cysteine--tRNA ligase [Candidatus Staskawiczbacteria bacterium RIFOXYC1_FULL_37_43]|nr:MAG: cysteine--tRNA ligase [Candidatus Staskawiczbacteria bacterium RIFCSPHIGHO2_01_FULL_37_17]OGZ72492.1 MAG: cysteine--tRNA ligase [Candidatus Staskawiczbacteria bacterium RIFCSPLOWO2_01_FULL_37_19]OGZ75655.1 MAG: cysteine--tRNA ligase [Candidatus Staskawiczbacteria bacterium RIFOXYA1_FULL_37_15]OGZ77419.1 MAG: cysteine--tRNA ligase [Candidatus Staskawiczbacteria bacterium RIFOXYA12_FULL_37_10]OGZ79932.1 MAG: cysteine--tRNA ligase [Candidatus Staskawiczbacteria bacterium RIFOXYB1_FULL_38_3